MPLDNVQSPAPTWQVGNGANDKAFDNVGSKRSARRQRLSARLHAAGPRPVLEALLAVESGQPLDEVLEDFGRIPADVYHAVGAHTFSKPFLN